MPWFDKPPDDGGVPLLQRHERNIRFQLAAVDEHKALIVEHGIKLGSRNEAMAVPNTLTDICGREVTVFHFVGGATLVDSFYAAFAYFQEDMKQKRPDTLQRYNQVWATSNGGLMDVTLLDERTSPNVLDHLPEDPHHRREVASETQAGGRGAPLAEEETRVDVQGRRGA